MALYDDDGSSCNNKNGSRPPLDRLSDLPDDILALVLERVLDGDGDVRPLARTCVLSKRWRSLPLMVSRLEVSVRSFLPPAASHTLPVRCLHEATSKLTDALRFFLATPTAGGGTVKKRRLTLRLCLTKHHHRMLEIGRLLSSAVARGEVQALAIVVDTNTMVHRGRRQYADDHATRHALAGMRHGLRFMRLFRAAAAGAVVASALTQLALRSLCLGRASDVESILRACEALETLHLDGCWFFAASSTTLRIDAPRSRLQILKITGCDVGSVHVVRLPCLLRLGLEGCPVTFGPASAPALKCVTLVNWAAPGQMAFKLSDLQLENANAVEYLCLDLDADRSWVQPENRRNPRAAFSKLKELRVRNISPNAGISWTMFLVKAAPLLELIDIHVSHDHICSGGGVGEDAHQDDMEGEALSDYFEHNHLRTVKIRGAAIADADGDSRFLRLVLERAVNLELLLLQNDKVTCTYCIRVAAQQEDPSTVLSAFPEDKDDIDAFVTRLKDGIHTSARIVVHTASNDEFEY